MDTISQQRISLLHPAVRDSVTKVITDANASLTGRAQVRIAQGFRSFPEQHALFIQRPKVTNADAGYSWHNYGLAFDIVLILDGKTASWDMTSDFDMDHVPDWMEVVKIAKAAGWSWGGDWKSFKDNPHFEMTFNLTIEQALAIYKKGFFIEGTKYIKLPGHG